MEKRMKKKWVEFLLRTEHPNEPNMILRIDVSFLDDCDKEDALTWKNLECAVNDFFRMKLPYFYDECELTQGFYISLNPPTDGVGWELVVCGDNNCGWFYEPPKLDRYSISV